MNYQHLIETLQFLKRFNASYQQVVPNLSTMAVSFPQVRTNFFHLSTKVIHKLTLHPKLSTFGPSFPQVIHRFSTTYPHIHRFSTGILKIPVNRLIKLSTCSQKMLTTILVFHSLFTACELFILLIKRLILSILNPTQRVGYYRETDPAHLHLPAVSII